MASSRTRIVDKSGPSEWREEIPLHMLRNKKTEMYVKFAKTVLMYQGAYSDARSKELEELQKTFNYASQVISDETYRVQGKTTCSYERTKEFYDYFLSETQRALEEGNNLVVLDPTMSSTKQNQHYLALARKMQCVFLVRPPVVTQGSSGQWPARSQARSFMDCGTVIQYSNMFQHLFCAWFLHDIDSLELRHVAKLFVQDCLEEIPDFRKMFARICPVLEEEEEEDLKAPSDEEEDEEYTLDDYRAGKHKAQKPPKKRERGGAEPQCTAESFARHFHLEEQRQDLAYCAVKICRGMKDMIDYFRDEEVSRAYGKMARLLVAGFVVSPHSVSARIKLTREQKNVWDLPDDVDENGSAELRCVSQLARAAAADLPEVQMRLICSKSNQTLINSGLMVREPFENIHPHARARSCHVVLGRAPEAPDRNVDYDVAFALKREQAACKEDTQVYDLERCVVKRLGKYWIIYLKEMYSVNAMFASCCKPFAYENAIH